MHHNTPHHPTVQIPQWPTLTDYPPSDADSSDSDLADPPIDIYSCDEFRIYDFKVRRCPCGRSHDWTDCPYAHPGEKARRRDPRRFHYSGTPCPDFKKGECPKGDSCELAHGVFECWLHPTKYRTQPCKDGTCCKRRVCFFAHTLEQLRVSSSPKSSGKATSTVPDSYDGSPMRMMKSGGGGGGGGGLCFLPTTSILSPASTEFSPFFSSSSSSSSSPVSPDALAAMLIRKMRVSEEAARPKMGFDADYDEIAANINNDGTSDNYFYGLDVGWISELMK